METWRKTFERFMCAAAFAEEGDWDTARIVLDADKRKFQQTREIQKKERAVRPRIRA